jgi:nucleoid-associated protein YejK
MARRAEEKTARAEIAAFKASLKSKKTITCVKGKILKKVTAAAPKCPAGYTKK